MRNMGRAAALVAVVGMPMVAYALARACVTMWEGRNPASLADAGVALEDGLVFLAAAIGAAIATYLAMTGYAMLLGAAWRGGRSIPRAVASLAPAGWTRVTATALGLTLSAGLAAPALASEADSTPAPSAGWVTAPVSVVIDPEVTPAASPGDGHVVLAVGWVEADEITRAAPAPPGDLHSPAPTPPPVPELPDDVTPLETTGSAPAPSTPATPAIAPPPAVAASSAPADASPQTPNTHVVQPGESLWRITKELLGTDASTARVAEAWPQLYEANRELIGVDPGLIQPGLSLTIPAGLGS